MPIGTCDPASRGDAFNIVEIVEGQVSILCRYGWDGVSVMPTCDGPVEDIRVRNTGTVTMYATLPNKRRGGKFIEIPPGTDSTLSGAQLTSLGLTSYSDVAGVGLHYTSTAPGTAKI